MTLHRLSPATIAKSSYEKGASRVGLSTPQLLARAAAGCRRLCGAARTSPE